MATKGVRIGAISGVGGDMLTIRNVGGGSPEVYELVVPGLELDGQSYLSDAMDASTADVWVKCGFPAVGSVVQIDDEYMLCVENGDPHGSVAQSKLSRGAFGSAVVAHAENRPVRFAPAPASGSIAVRAGRDDKGAALAEAITDATGKTLVAESDAYGYVTWLWSDDALEVEVTGGLSASGSALAASNIEVVIPVSGDGLADAVMAPCDVASVVSVKDADTGETIDASDVTLSGRRVTYQPNASAATRVRVELVVE